MTPVELVRDLATAIRAEVAPRLGQGREVVGVTESGDASFRLDQYAEEATARYLEDCPLPVALFSEDGGLVGDPGAEYLLVVDPIDGTRPAKAGLESCCVSVALAENRPQATLGDVVAGAIYELKTDRLFVGNRGDRIEILHEGRPAQPSLSYHPVIAGATASVEITGRPIVPTAIVLEDLIDTGSLRGGTFTFASTTFAVTRLITGQLDCHVDVADRIRRDLPELAPLCRRAGVGNLIALYVYDIAAVVLLARCAGLTLTDAYGRSLDNVPLTDVSERWHRSCVAAANAELHRAIMESIESGMVKLRERWREVLNG